MANTFNPKEHLIPLKGKAYLQVAWRLVWFREEKPNWSIDTQSISITDDSAIFIARICDENGVQKSSGHGSETKKDFGDYLEKAETKAVGRALAMLGYGTQFAPELDEGERIVDSPVKLKPNVDTDGVKEQPAATQKPRTAPVPRQGLTREQAKEVMLAANGDVTIVNGVLMAWGYRSSQAVPQERYDELKAEVSKIASSSKTSWAKG